MPRGVVVGRRVASPAGGTGRPPVAPPNNVVAIPAATAALVFGGEGERATGSGDVGVPVHWGADLSATGAEAVVPAQTGAGTTPVEVVGATASPPDVGTAARASGRVGVAEIVAGGGATSTTLAAPSCRAEYCHPAKAIATTPTVPATTATSQFFDRAGGATATDGARRGGAKSLSEVCGDAIAPGTAAGSARVGAGSVACVTRGMAGAGIVRAGIVDAGTAPTGIAIGVAAVVGDAAPAAGEITVGFDGAVIGTVAGSVAGAAAMTGTWRAVGICDTGLKLVVLVSPDGGLSTVGM